MAELEDALGSESSGSNPVEVQVLLSAQNKINNLELLMSWLYYTFKKLWKKQFKKLRKKAPTT